MRKFTLLLAAAAFSATVANAQGYTLNPEAGVAEDLQGITVTFDEPTYFYENNRMAAATLENTTTGVTYVCDTPTMNSRATGGLNTEYSLTFVQEGEEEAETVINVPGEYTLTIKAMYTGTEEDPTDLEPITAEYTVEFPVEYTLNPASGSTVKDLQGISLVFPEGGVSFYENNRMNVAVLENLTTGTLYVCQDAMLNGRPSVDGQEYVLAFTDEDGELVNKINEPGEYLLTVRGMYLGEDPNEGEALPVIQASYVVEYPAPYVLTPAPNTGEAVKNLQGITIDFTADKVGFYENNRVPVAVLENTTTGKNYYCWEADRNAMAATEGAFYTFNFVDEEEEADNDGIIPVVEEITEPGNYKLTIRAMYVSSVDEDGEEVMEDLPVITVNYTIDYPYAYVLTPADGSTVANLQGITLVFTEAAVNFYENNRMPVAVLENVETGAEFLCYEPDMNPRTTEGAVEYTFMFMDEDDEVLESITQPGSYKLTIKGMYVGELEYPEGEGEGDDEDNVEALADDEEGSETETTVDLPVIYANYTIAYPYPYLLEPANEAVVSKIESVTIDFYQNKNIAFTENNRMPVAVLANGLEGDDVVDYVCNEANMNPRAESEGRVYTFVFSDENDEVVAINEPGLWYLTIRGLIVLGENEDGEEVEVDTLPVINAVYYVDGEEEGSTKVEDLTSPDGLYNVYSISGVQVVKNGSVNALKSLGKGIYVINGKKVVL